MTASLRARSALTPAARHTAFREGVRDITPMVVGVVPFGLAIGATIGTADVDALTGIAGAPVILAGAAQLGAIQMLDAGAAPIAIVFSALMINARLLLYSASIAPWFRDEPLRRRLLLAVPVIDQLHFTCVPRFEQGDLDRAGRLAYYAGASMWLAGAWIACQTIAVAVGAQIPDAIGLRVAAPLALIGLLTRSLTDRRSVAAATAAAFVAVIGVGSPFRSAVMIAAVSGVAVGTAVDRRTAAQPAGHQSGAER